MRDLQGIGSVKLKEVLTPGLGRNGAVATWRRQNTKPRFWSDPGDGLGPSWGNAYWGSKAFGTHWLFPNCERVRAFQGHGVKFVKPTDLLLNVTDAYEQILLNLRTTALPKTLAIGEGL